MQRVVFQRINLEEFLFKGPRVISTFWLPKATSPALPLTKVPTKSSANTRRDASSPQINALPNNALSTFKYRMQLEKVRRMFSKSGCNFSKNEKVCSLELPHLVPRLALSPQPITWPALAKSPNPLPIKNRIISKIMRIQKRKNGRLRKIVLGKLRRFLGKQCMNST